MTIPSFADTLSLSRSLGLVSAAAVEALARFEEAWDDDVELALAELLKALGANAEALEKRSALRAAEGREAASGIVVIPLDDIIALTDHARSRFLMHRKAQGEPATLEALREELTKEADEPFVLAARAKP